MSIPVIFTQSTPNMPVTTSAQLADTAGSMETILDVALVNGANQVSIVSISRSGNIATIETSAPHLFKIGETLHLQNIGIPNFEGKFKPHQIIDSTHVTIRVSDTGATTSGAVGTIKLAAAGWAKIAISPGVVCYQSALFPDGESRYVQIEDNSPYGNSVEFRIRVAKQWTDLNIATKISAPRRFSKTNYNDKWAIIADDKTIQFFFSGASNYYCGEFIGFEPTDLNCCCLSTGYDGSNYGNQFGAVSNASPNQVISYTNCTILESQYNATNDTFGAVSLLGVPGEGGSLSTKQAIFRYVNPFNGKYVTFNVDIWEKIADNGQCFFPRGRAKGLLQPIGKLPINVLTETIPGWFLIREQQLDGSYIDYALFSTTSVTPSSSSHLTINLTTW